MAEAAVPKQPLPTQSAPHQPHPDLAAAMESAQRSREYHNHRLLCFTGQYQTKVHDFIAEKNQSRIPEEQTPNPPTGEMCVGLLQHSSDVQRNPQQLAERPEKGILAPYNQLRYLRGWENTPTQGKVLLDEYTKAVQQNLAQKNMVLGLLNPADGPGKPTRKFPLLQGGAVDVGYSQTVLDALKSRTTPPKPTRSENELYSVAEQCFLSDPSTTLGQCFRIGQDLAAQQLNSNSAAVTLTPLSSPTAANVGKVNQR